MGALVSWLQRLFWSQEMEIAILGLANAGKSSFVNILSTGVHEENLMPTLGFQMSKVTKGKVTIKIWDMGGQRPLRKMWEKYCRGCEVIAFVVDSADVNSFKLASSELHTLLARPSVVQIPLLVLMNKNDLSTAVPAAEIANLLGLDKIKDRDVAYYSTSCKTINNIDKAVDWIVQHNKSSRKAASSRAIVSAAVSETAVADEDNHKSDISVRPSAESNASAVDGATKG